MSLWPYAKRALGDDNFCFIFPFIYVCIFITPSPCLDYWDFTLSLSTPINNFLLLFCDRTWTQGLSHGRLALYHGATSAVLTPVSPSTFAPQTCYVAKDDLELHILLPPTSRLPRQCWYYRLAPPSAGDQTQGLRYEMASVLPTELHLKPQSLVFRDKVSFGSGWPKTCDLPAFASRVLGSIFFYVFLVRTF